MSQLDTDRKAPAYRPEAQAGWEYRMVSTMHGGGERFLLCEVLWAQGKVVVARPVRMPLAASMDLWRPSWDEVQAAAQKAQKRPVLEVDGGLVEWLERR